MPEIVTYLHAEELIFIEGSGKVTYNQIKNSIDQGIKYSNEYHVKNVLINHINVESVPEATEVFNLGSLTASKFQGFCFAVIYPAKFKEYYLLFEKTVNKRGTGIKLFEDKNAALGWLNSLKLKESAG